MARQRRIHFPGAFYHIMLRGNNKKQIFFTTEDKKYFYFLIKESIKKYTYQIHGFCLMNNHVHLLIQVNEISISKIMHNIAFRYTAYINQNHRRVGHIFQGRFKAILVDEENYLLSLIRYIHLNPVKAKITNDAKDYMWSSHRAYLGLEKISWLTTKIILEKFSASSSARSQYDHYCKNSFEEDSKHFRSGNQKKLAILGSDNFMKKIKTQGILQTTTTIQELDKFICSHYSVNHDHLIGFSRNRELCKLRGLIGFLAKKFNICSLNEVAKYLKRDTSGIARLVRNVENNKKYESEINNCIQLLNKSFF